MARTYIALCTVAVLALAIGPVPHARACGGFFCSSVPIDQAGENLVFAMEADGSVTAHIQILYTGPSETFAWILPVPSVPTISVGTDALFQQLGFATAPSFRLESRTEGTCRAAPECAVRSYGEAGAAFRDASARADGGPVEVLSTGQVGPYETAVVTSTDGAALYTWLRDNGYDIPASAEPEITYYVSTGHAFVALRLQKDRDAGEIQPIVLHYASGEPCIPLRLTRIAATPDMPVTAYFLAAQGVMSLEYPTVEPSLDDPSIWYGSPTAYLASVGAVVNESGGRAFVNEYSGPVPALYLDLGVDLEPLRTVTSATAFVQQVSVLLSGDSQLLSILERRIPPPPGVTSRDFFNCLARGCGLYDAYAAALAFDPSGTVDDLNAAIIEPRADAQAMLARHTRITRLFTVISPDEMTADPTFMASASVPLTSNVHQATQVFECSARYVAQDAPSRLDLPSGRTVRLAEGTPYPVSDNAWCRAHYGVDARTPGSPATPPGTDAAVGGGIGGGGGCAVAPHGDPGALVVVLGALGAVTLARRRRGRDRG